MPNYWLVRCWIWWQFRNIAPEVIFVQVDLLVQNFEFVESTLYYVRVSTLVEIEVAPRFNFKHCVANSPRDFFVAMWDYLNLNVFFCDWKTSIVKAILALTKLLVAWLKLWIVFVILIECWFLMKIGLLFLFSCLSHYISERNLFFQPRLLTDVEELYELADVEVFQVFWVHFRPGLTK